MTRIAIVDDHVLLGQVLASDLRNRGFVADVMDLGPDLVDRIRQLAPDIVLLDLELGPDMPSGCELVYPLVQSGAAVIVLTGVENDIIRARCLESGAKGILPKRTDFDQLVAQITSSIATGEIAPSLADRLELLQGLTAHRRAHQDAIKPFLTLTERESQILVDLMAGQSAAEISESSYVAISTVRTQVKSILRKLDVTAQLQAVALAHSIGWPHVLESQDRRRRAS